MMMILMVTGILSKSLLLLLKKGSAGNGERKLWSKHFVQFSLLSFSCGSISCLLLFVQNDTVWSHKGWWGDEERWHTGKWGEAEKNRGNEKRYTIRGMMVYGTSSWWQKKENTRKSKLVQRNWVEELNWKMLSGSFSLSSHLPYLRSHLLFMLHHKRDNGFRVVQFFFTVFFSSLILNTHNTPFAPLLSSYFSCLSVVWRQKRKQIMIPCEIEGVMHEGKPFSLPVYL